jgi:hypothetical protein
MFLKISALVLGVSAAPALRGLVADAYVDAPVIALEGEEHYTFGLLDESWIEPGHTCYLPGCTALMGQEESPEVRITHTTTLTISHSRPPSLSSLTSTLCRMIANKMRISRFTRLGLLRISVHPEPMSLNTPARVLQGLLPFPQKEQSLSTALRQSR